MQENRSNIVAHFCTWLGVNFGKPDVFKVRTECSLPPVTHVISTVLLIRLSDETQTHRSKKVKIIITIIKKKHKAEYLNLK